MRLTPLFKLGTSKLRGEMISDQGLCIATGFPDIGHQNRQPVNENPVFTLKRRLAWLLSSKCLQLGWTLHAMFVTFKLFALQRQVIRLGL